MPYWTSSRVGAVPQQKATKRSDQWKRQQGITMEDLKAQTALRLAKEQHDHQGRGLEPPSSSSGSFQVVNPSPTHALHPQLSGSSQTDRRYAGNVADNVHRPQYHSRAPEPQYLLHGMESSPTVVAKLPVVGTHPTYQQAPPEPVLTTADCKKSSSMSQSSFDSKNGKQPKLPHGLTVHELKEMTKARLQAEADEQGKTTVTAGPVPSTVSVVPEYRDQHAMARSQASPLPPGFAHTRLNSGSPYPEAPRLNSGSPYPEVENRYEAWSQESRGDAWETASASTAASDYLPPDTFPAATEDYSFGRPRAYPTNANNMQESNQLQSLSPSFYDGGAGSYPQNRRRAATLSPRPGLTHLHEDRPVLSGDGGPGIPSFSSARRLVPARNRVTYNNDSYSRARTSSTTSLPAISHTAEEFGDTPLLFSSPYSVHEDTAGGVTGLVDVFRDSPSSFNGRSAADSDLGISASSSNGYGGSFGDERARAATWSGHTSDLFGPGLFDSCNDDTGQDTLAGDLASILKLSGAEEKSERLFYPPPGL